MQHSLPESIKFSPEIMIDTNVFGGAIGGIGGTCTARLDNGMTWTVKPEPNTIQHDNIANNEYAIISRIVCS